MARRTPPGLGTIGQRPKAASRPPDRSGVNAARRAADAGTIVLGASDQDLWQVAASPSSYGPQTQHEAMEEEFESLEEFPRTSIMNNQLNMDIQNNQLNMVDASTH